MTTRRGVLRALAVLPAAAAVPPVEARDDAGRDEVLAAVESLAAVVEARLGAIVRAAPGASRFAASVRADLARHRRQRGTAPAAAPEPDDGASLPRLRAAVAELTYAHAEGLPALGDRVLVQRLAEHMVDLSRILTVLDLWMEMEGLE